MKQRLINYLPILTILIVWFIFASPYFIKGLVPFPSTYQVNNFAPWSTNEKFWGPVKNGAMPDIITQIYPWKYFAIQTFKTGQIPLWNPYSFSGTPHLANYQSAVLSPFNLLFFIFSFIDAWSLLVLLQPLLAGFFVYLFVRSLNVSKIGSIISALSFMFCGFITVWMGYGTLGYAILFLPLALFAIEKYFISQKIRYLLILTLSVPLSFFSGHFQISVYFILFILSYILFKFLLTKDRKTTLNILMYSGFGLLISSLQLVPSIESYTQSLRSALFEKGEAIPWQYLPTFLAPDFFGNPVTRNDWFGHYAEWNAYIGVLPFMFAIYSFIRNKGSQTLFFFTLGIISLLLAFDTPLLTLLISLHLPVLSTSAASRIIVLYSFSFAVLAGFGLDQLVKDFARKRIKQFLLWIGIFSLIFFILWVIIIFKLFMPMEKIAIAKSNLLLPTLLFLISSVVIVSSRYIVSKKIHIFSALFLLIVIFDMLRFANKWMPFDPKKLVFPDMPATNYFSKISGYERVIGNLGGEAVIYYQLPSTEGYDALYNKRYGEFISSIQDGKIKTPSRSVVLFPKSGIYTPQAINLLGIRYIIHKFSDGRASWTFPFWTYPDGTFKLIYNDSKYEIYENKKAFPRAFLADKYEVIANPQKTVDTLFNKNFDSRSTAILEENPNFSINKNNEGNVRIIQYKPDTIDLVVNSKFNSLLILTDNYYPGWKAEIDGKSVPIYKANYTFRAIPITSGQHRVNFTYDPNSFRLGLYLAITGIFGVIVATVLLRKKV